VRLDVVILQLKQLCPYFRGNVAGAAAYARGIEDQVWLDTPAAYVVPLDEDAAENQDQGAGLYQTVTERVNVIVQFDNRADRRGQTVTENLNPVQYMLYAALLGWRPNSSIDNPGLVLPTDPGADVSIRGMQAAGGGLIAFDLARLFWRFTFIFESAISDADGWQPPSEPLTDVQSNTGPTRDIEFDVTLPQT
jgi:hypothetical protein